LYLVPYHTFTCSDWCAASTSWTRDNVENEMQNLRLENLSTTELLDVRDSIDVLLKDRVADERREIQRMLARIGEAGSDRPIRGRARSTLKGTKVAPKYRNPATGETWAGRGATPRWLQALLQRGRKLAGFAIEQAGGKKHDGTKPRMVSRHAVKRRRRKKAR
jgi:DNA-binding protein H-NS